MKGPSQGMDNSPTNERGSMDGDRTSARSLARVSAHIPEEVVPDSQKVNVWRQQLQECFHRDTVPAFLPRDHLV